MSDRTLSGEVDFEARPEFVDFEVETFVVFDLADEEEE